MKVLSVGDLESPHSTRWAEAMAAHGHAVVRAGFGDPGDSKVAAVELGPRASSNGRFMKAIPALATAARRIAPDVVHAHFVSSYGVLATLAVPRPPLVLFAWGSDILWDDRRSRVQRRLTRVALRRARSVVCDSADVGAAIEVMSPGTRPELVYFGPEASWCVAPRIEGHRILSPRLLRPFYNVESVVRGFARAGASTDWQLDVLTAGTDFASLRQVARDEGVEDAVTFHPRLPRPDVQDLFLRAAIVCSIPDSDATAASLLEAMAAGALPIVSDLPANRALIEDDVNGLIVADTTPDAVAAAITAGMEPERQERARRHNRPWIAEHASFEASGDRVDQLTVAAVS